MPISELIKITSHLTRDNHHIPHSTHLLFSNYLTLILFVKN